MVTTRWLTVQQVAEVLQVRIETVRRWIRRGDIPVLDIGGPRTVYRIRQSDLDEFVRNRYWPGSDAPASQVDGGEGVSGIRGDAVATSTTIDDQGDTRDPRELVERMPAVTFRENRRRSGTPDFLSQEIETLLGYSAHDLMETPGGWLDIVHPDDRTSILSELDRTDKTGEPFRMDYRMFHRDGRTVWVRVDAILVDNDDGGAWEGAIVDITERRILEVALRRRQIQQQVIAVLGKTALDGVPIRTLLRETAQRVCQAMGATRVLLYEMLPGGVAMVERAHYHAGVQRDLDGSSPVTAGTEDDADPLSAFAIGQREPVVSERLARDTRFQGDEMESVLGVQSGASLAIPGRVRPYGVLTVLASEPKPTSHEDLLFLQSVVNILGSTVAQADNHWLTVTEVAEMLQVTEETVRRWIRNLDLPALSLGGSRAGYRVYPSDLERFIQHRLKRLK